MAGAQTCPACGSAELGRGRTRSAWQELVRDLTPFRRFRCRACGREGWTARRLPRSQHPAELARGADGPALVGRPPEARDRSARWRGLARSAGAVGLALLLGAAVANRLMSCQGSPASSSDRE